MAAISTVVDNFDDNSRNAFVWNEYETGVATVNETNGQLQIALATSLATQFGSYSADVVVAGYDFTGSYVYVELVQGPNAATSADAFFYVILDGSNWFRWVLEAGTLYAQRNNAGVTATLDSEVYDASAHRWLRLREESGVVYYGFSSNGIEWTELTTYTHGMTITAMRPEVGANTFQAETNPGTVIWDNLNTLSDNEEPVEFLNNNRVYDHKKYVYKVYDNDDDDTYLGSLTNEVISEFTFTQELNSAGSITDIELARISDYGPGTILAIGNRIDVFVYYGQNSQWIDHEGDEIVDHNGNGIVFSHGAPNGRRIFTGVITRVVPRFGEDNLMVTLASFGIELNNTVMEEIRSVYQSPGDMVANIGHGNTASVQRIAQIFQPTISDELLSFVPIVSPVTANTTDPATYHIDIYHGSNPNTDLVPGNLLGTSSFTHSPNTTLIWFSILNEVWLDTFTWYDLRPFEASQGIALQAGEKYIALMYPDAASIINPASDSFNYLRDTPVGGPGGQTVWQEVGGTWTERPNDQAYFNLIMLNGEIRQPFLSYDPSEILRVILDNHVRRNGNVSYTTESIVDTSTIVSYTFRLNTVLEGINKVLELSPSNWFWFLDQGTNLIWFRPQRFEPDFYVTKGKEVQELQVEENVEEVVNVVFFSGGDDGTGNNVFIKRTNPTSIAAYGKFTARLSDNRVTTYDSAEIIAQYELERGANPTYRTQLTINTDSMDIETIQIGMMVGFRNFNNYIDNLQLQVTSIRYTPHFVTLVLDSLLPKVSKRLEDIKRQLNLQETQDNPSQPE